MDGPCRRRWRFHDAQSVASKRKRRPSQTSGRDFGGGSSWVPSEIELDRELHESGSQDRLRLLPVREGIALRQYHVGIERVEDVDARRHAHPVEPKRLANAQVELVQPLAVHRL